MHYCDWPKLDPTPLHEVYSAISAWYEDHNANRVPDQEVLFATLEQAMLLLNSVEVALWQRASETRKESHVPVAEQAAGIALTPEAKTILETLAREANMCVTQEALAGETRLSPPTVRKHLDFLRANGLVQRPHGDRKGDAITEAGLTLIGRG